MPCSGAAAGRCLHSGRMSVFSRSKKRESVNRMQNKNGSTGSKKNGNTTGGKRGADQEKNQGGSRQPDYTPLFTGRTRLIVSVLLFAAFLLASVLLRMGEDPAEGQEAWQENETWQDGAGQGFTSRSGGEDSMEVHFIDVGQGDATLILCDGTAMLIDCADNSQGTRIQDYLQKQGVEKLDYLVLTHPDSDHIGGAPVIIEKFEIDRVFMSNFEKSNKTYMKVIQSLDNRLLKWSTPEVGSTWQLGSAQFTILAPNDTYSDPNEASIALIIRNGDNTFLFTGDAEDDAEDDMLENGLDLRADVYQAGHHGSRSSSKDEFLDEVSPVYAVISCAEGNSYGHPHAATLNKFRERGILVFRTDEQGSIVAVSDGTTITWNCAPSDTWKAGEPTGSGK